MPLARRRSLALLVLWAISLPAAAATERAIIVVVDGLPYAQAWSTLPGESTMPRVSAEIVPHATMWSRCFNRGVCYTTPAHESIVTGRYQWGPNTKGIRSSRALDPTLFESWRHYAKADSEDIWIVHGKIHLDQLDHSWHPTGGNRLSSNHEHVPGTDRQVVERFIEILESRAPHLALLNLAGVDDGGHTSDWDIYTDRILEADSLLVELWDWIEADSLYSGVTNLVITSDHGRHDDLHGGFTDHGGVCDGCRHVPLLSIGPDTPAGEVRDELCELIDVAPTVAGRLNLPMPMARGRDLLTDATPIVRRRDPAIAAIPGGVLVAYTEIVDNERHTRVDRYEDWGPHLAFRSMTTFGGGGARPDGVSIDAKDNQAVLTWIDHEGDGKTGRVRAVTSSDGGRSWSEPSTLHSGQEEAWPELRSIQPLRPRTRWVGSNWITAVPNLESSLDFIGPGVHGQINSTWKPLQPDITYTNGTLTAVWIGYTHRLANESGTYRLHISSSQDSGASWSEPWTLTNPNDPVFHPRVFAGETPGSAYVLYNQRGVDGTWRVLVTSTRDHGLQWSRPKTLNPPGIKRAWQSDASNAGNDSWAVTWTEYWDSGSRIALRWFIDKKAQEPKYYGAPGAWSEHPVLASQDGRVYLAWQEIGTEETIRVERLAVPPLPASDRPNLRTESGNNDPE